MMDITIKGEAKEIAALLLEVQGRQATTQGQGPTRYYGEHYSVAYASTPKEQIACASSPQSQGASDNIQHTQGSISVESGYSHSEGSETLGQ